MYDFPHEFVPMSVLLLLVQLELLGWALLTNDIV